MKRILWLLLLPFCSAVLFYNSSELINSTIQTNETVIIEDLNITIEVLNNTISTTIYENCTFNHTEYNITYNETVNLFGNYTVYGPENITCSECEDCGTQVNYHVERDMNYNETISWSSNTKYCNVSYFFTSPTNTTQECEEVVCNTTASCTPVSVDATRKPGECYTKTEGSMDISICCDTAEVPECQPEKQTVYQTLLDLSELGRPEDCERPVYLDDPDEWLCLDDTTKYCPAEIMTKNGCPGCTEYAVERAVESCNNNLTACESDLTDMEGDISEKNGEIGTLKAKIEEEKGKAQGCYLGAYEILVPAILFIAAVLIGVWWYFNFHNKDAVPHVSDSKEENKRFKFKEEL